MNSFNLALRNIKKCFRDYVVYFLTLIIGVAIFYVFNSVGDQSVVKEIAGAQYEVIDILLLVLDAVSIGVAFILGFLIIYTNNFLIRRRKKEFGVYLLLGMGKRKVSKILMQETVIVGVLSLGIGLVIGVFASQLMSILVGKLFDADMSKYTFVVSGSAIGKTVLNFVVLYVIVLVFHTVTISKYKLIDLLAAEKKTEKHVLNNPVLASVVFVFAAVALGYAYYRVGFCAKDMKSSEMLLHICVGIVTTLLLFWALSGFLLTMLRRWKGMYHKNLNSFVLRQFCNSMNSSAISMGIICLMLFVTICTFSAGFSVVHEMQANLRELTAADYSIVSVDEVSVTEVLRNSGIDVKKVVGENSVEVPVYQNASLTWEVSFGSEARAAREQFPNVMWEEKENIMSVSDYNAVATVYGKETIELEENEFAIVCNFGYIKDIRNKMLARGETIQIGEYTLTPAYTECVDGYIMMESNALNTGVVVVHDSVVARDNSNLWVNGQLLVGDYAVRGDSEKKDADQSLLAVTDKTDDIRSIKTKISIREASNGAAMMVAFIVIYLGVVFLISSAAILALKALSESIDSEGKYAILKKIGSDTKRLKRALFAQISVYFVLPLLLACVHSIFGLRFADFVLSTVMQEGMYWGAGVTTIVLAVLYGGYLFATYKGSKRIVGA